MSQKTAKKIKQQYRRDMREGVQEIIAEFRDDLIGNSPIKPKPKFVPRALWSWIVRKVINQSFFDKWYA